MSARLPTTLAEPTPAQLADLARGRIPNIGPFLPDHAQPLYNQLRDAKPHDLGFVVASLCGLVPDLVKEVMQIMEVMP